jgi:hypothetical protein
MSNRPWFPIMRERVDRAACERFASEFPVPGKTSCRPECVAQRRLRRVHLPLS